MIKISLESIKLIGISLIGIPRSALDEAGGLFPPSIYYKFFENIAMKYKPKVSVILGVCGGGDSYHLCKGNNEGIVVGVDIARDHQEQMLFIEDRCLGFRFWLGDSVKSAPKIYEEYGPIDFLFIDTVHEEDATISEWNAWLPYLSKNAIICFDDLFRPGMQEAWDKLPEPKIRMDWLHDGTYPHGGGFGVLIYSENKNIPHSVYELGN
jgi:predicted O-methyltransferase YrrM